MKKLNPIPRDWRPFPDPTEKAMNPSPKMVWMTDLKKMGERAECLWSRNHRKGAR